MKRFLAIALFLCPLSLKAIEQHDLIDLSAGLYSYPSANKIPENSASYIQNFFTDIQGMAVERNGSILLDSNIGSTSKPILGMWRFVDSTGSEWIIEYSSRTFYKHTAGNSPVSFGPSTVTTNLPRAATNLGKIIFVNGVDTPWEFNGTTATVISGAPVGTLIIPWRTRFVIGNISGSQSTLRFSADGDETNWTLGGNPTDPFSIQIGGANDGYPIKCLGIYSDYLIAQRKYDSWAISGFDQSDIQSRNISTEIGCIEPGTNREYDGSYLFLSARGMEEMKGSQIQSISDPIRDTTDILIHNTVNQRSAIFQLASDSNAGTFSSANYVDTATVSNQLRMMYPDTFDTFRNTSPLNLWQGYRSGGATGTASVSGGQLYIQNDGSNVNEVCLVQDNFYYLNDFQQGTTYHIQISSSIGSDALDRNSFFLTLSSSPRPGLTGSASPDSFSNFWTYRFAFESVGNVSLISGSNSSGDSVFTSSTIALPVDVDLYIATTVFTLSFNGAVVKTGSHTWPHNKLYSYLCNKNSTSGTGSVVLDNFTVAPQTFTFTTSLISIGNAISSWSPFLAVDGNTNTPNSINYQVGSTNTASVSSISNYTAVSRGMNPSVSTNPYAAVRAYFIANSTGPSPYLSQAILQWAEGTAIQFPASTVYDRRYWISLTTTTSSGAVLDSIYVYQRNRTWTLLKGLYTASFAIWGDRLYLGDSNPTGNSFQFDIGNSDNGNAINSQIISKSYDYGKPANPKEFSRCYIDYLSSPTYSGSFSLSYDLDRYGQLYSLGSANMNNSSGFLASKFKFPLSQNVRGYEIKYTLTKNGIGDRLKLYGIHTVYATKEEQ